MEIVSDDVREQQADTLAQESLIPSSVLEQVVWSPDSSFDDITTGISARTRSCYRGRRPMAAGRPELQEVFEID